MKMRTSTQIRLSLVLFGALATFCTVSAQARLIYWTDLAPGSSSSIKRLRADGSGIETLITGLLHPRGMTLDVPGGKMYWTEAAPLGIRRANLDGTGIAETVVPLQAGFGFAHVVVDDATGKMYWTNTQVPVIAGGGRIQRANLDGSGVEDVVTDNLMHPVGIALDLAQEKVYWTDLEGNLDGTGKIQRSNLDGSNVETLLTGIDEANGIAVDAVGGKMYWPEITTGKIQRANLDGTGVEDLVVGLGSPTTIGLDQGKMYWTDSNQGGQLNRIERANYDGSDREVIVSGGFPWGIAVASCNACPCFGDFDGDGIVGLSDLAQMLSSFGTCQGNPRYNPAADFDNDLCVDLTDLSNLLSVFGRCVQSP